MDEQQALGEPYQIEWRGKTLRFAAIEQSVKARCISAAKLAAMREHRENLDLLYAGGTQEDLQAKQAAENAFRDDMITGRWKWNGDLRRAWQKQPEGLMVFISALLEAGGTPLTEPEIYALAEERQHDVFAIIALADWDITNPKAKRPANLETLAKTISRLPTSTRS